MQNNEPITFEQASKWGLRFAVVLSAIVSVLLSCEDFRGDIRHEKKGLARRTDRWIDKEAGVVCYGEKQGSGYGLSCVPLKDTKLELMSLP